VTTEAMAIGRISAFGPMGARTPWPVFTLGMLQADIIGALLVPWLPPVRATAEDRIQLQDLPAFNLAIFLGYLFLSFTIASFLTLRLLIPVMAGSDETRCWRSVTRPPPKWPSPAR